MKWATTHLRLIGCRYKPKPNVWLNFRVSIWMKRYFFHASAQFFHKVNCVHFKRRLHKKYILTSGIIP